MTFEEKRHSHCDKCGTRLSKESDGLIVWEPYYVVDKKIYCIKCYTYHVLHIW